MTPHPSWRAWVTGTAMFLAVLLAWPRPSDACGWDWETLFAEGNRLPCVHDVVVGHYATHTPEYHERMAEAAEWGLAWAPGWTPALDARGLSLMRLGKMVEAKTVMSERLALTPDAYPAHANLGTLLTFTGDYDQALVHIDRAMKIEPKAHFGRERYHRKLVEFLKARKAEPDSPVTKNFLGFALSDEQRKKGDPKLFDELGLEADVFDALTSMVSVYGAEDLPEMYVTLGDVLLARGMAKLAYAAYDRATNLGYPDRKADLEKWRRMLRQRIVANSSVARRNSRRGEYDHEHGIYHERPGGYHGIQTTIANRWMQADEARRQYHRWERAQLARGLPIWTEDGLAKIYARMDQTRLRCKVGHLLYGDRPDPGKPPEAKGDGSK